MECLHCSAPIAPPKRKFCCKEHKDSYNSKHLYGYKYTKKYRSKSPEVFIAHLLSYKNRRATLSKEFLCDLYYRQKGLCAISGISMTHEQSGGKCPSNISIDRIDSTKGYIEGNVQLVCSLVNTMKMQYTKEELLFWCRAIVDNNKEDLNATD